MPSMHSKMERGSAGLSKRTYDEPIPFIPVKDKVNVQKPKDIKISLRQNPAVANSPKVEKVFTEFVENTPEAYCRWRCDMDEYWRGANIINPAPKIQAALQLLSQTHKTTWENCVQQVVPGGAVTTDEEVTEIFEAFSLTFMSPTARRKQKRYMSSGAIQKPVGWSSRQVANRLTTLNRYLQYLPGTAGEFNEEELKDMLVDCHAPVYQHLMARANYDIDQQSYLQVMQYLQNLTLLEESFNQGGNKNRGNSEEKTVHKKNKHNKLKHGKAHCRKHPHGEHTWADCRDNPKSKNYVKKQGSNNNGNKKKEEARNMESDSEEDMDKQFEILDIAMGEAE